MANNDYLFLVLILVIVLIIILVSTKSKQDTFTSGKTMGKPCTRDSQCPDREFCYMGQCWGYWNGVNMPWSTCRNPYCGSKDADVSCTAARGKCSPYCKCRLNRRLGTSIGENCFPACGAPCLNNDECPQGCPACRHGICSAPGQYEAIL